MRHDTAVRVRGLRKRYGDTAAVCGIDFDITRGEVFTLLGPNGAGKTTTVEILAGYRQCTSGDVTVLGSNPAGAGRAWRARIGIVLQSGADAADLTVREMIRHFAGFYPSPADPGDVIARVGLTGKARSSLRHLSGGERRRVDVALGIVGNPELIFLDEPTTGFDPAARRQFWELIRGLASDGTTILLTTHYLEEAEALADRVGVIAGGRLVDVAAPDDLGGRAAAPATVSWLAGGERRVVRTHSPTAEVAGLAAHFGGEVPGLCVTRPTLEDTYLAMIGAAPAQTVHPAPGTAPAPAPVAASPAVPGSTTTRAGLAGPHPPTGIPS